MYGRKVLASFLSLGATMLRLHLLMPHALSSRVCELEQRRNEYSALRTYWPLVSDVHFITPLEGVYAP
jgi:hypothetical protein